MTIPKQLGIAGLIGLLFCIAVIAGLGYWTLRPSPDASFPRGAHDTSPSVSPPAASPLPAYKAIAARRVPGAAAAFAFTASIPPSWEIEAVPHIEALNIYDPAATGEGTLEKSQIFIRFFRANTFLTLSTVTVLERTPETVNGRPAVTYVIEKKPGIPDFPGQPSWRNRRHRVTDVRVTDQNPSVFYVFAKRPDLPDSIFTEFLASLAGDGFTETAALYYPIANFTRGITKKPFGIFVSPGNSPVSPERFTGFHTGVDVEAEPGIETVVAIADGRVVLARNASGYGGVVAIRHTIRGEHVLAVYGHLDPTALPAVGAAVRAGSSIGALGKAFSAETDFERGHLHFGIYRGEDTNIQGYVPTKEALERWNDPAALLKDATNSRG